MTLLIFLLFMAIALSIIAAKSVVIVKETERLVVFRLGQLVRVADPGRVILIPFLDKGVKVNIEGISKWRRLPKKELDAKAVEMASQINREGDALTSRIADRSGESSRRDEEG